MGTGKLPFEHQNTNQLFEQISNKAIDFGDAQLSNDFKELVQDILNKNPEKRLGYKGALDLKGHNFFRDISWTKCKQMDLQPLYVPQIKDDHDVSNFDEQFTSIDPIDSDTEVEDIDKLNEYQHYFKDFHFNPVLSSTQDIFKKPTILK